MVAASIRVVVPKELRPIGYLVSLTQRRCRLTVRGGPFAGMQYVEESAGSAYIPKLLGSYERELHSVIEAACRIGFAQIIDIGAAEGYYAVGMALRNPLARVVAFEAEESAQVFLSRMACINGLAARIEIAGRCEPSDLLAQTRRGLDPVLIICDVEGGEEELLKRSNLDAATQAWLLVELHEFMKPGIGSRLTREFAPTHHVTQIWQEDRSPTEFPFRTLGTRLLPARYLKWAVSEWRPERMSWLWMEPHCSSR